VELLQGRAFWGTPKVGKGVKQEIPTKKEGREEELGTD